MEKQMQNSIRYSVVSTIIKTSKEVEVGKLIGRKGRNLKPIAEKTGTYIHVIENTNPAQIEIKIINDRVGNISPGERIDEAKLQINKLLEDIETRSQGKDIVEIEEKKFRVSENGNHQNAAPRNYRDNDSKEKRKSFKPKMSHTTKTRQSRNKENVKRNVPVNRKSN